MVLVVGVLVGTADLSISRSLELHVPLEAEASAVLCWTPTSQEGALASILMEKKNAEMAITHMREFLQKMGSSSEDLEDGTLLRFLKSKSMNPEKAAKMFIGWEKWRAQIAPSGYVNEAEVRDMLALNNVFLQPTTKDGHSLAVVHVCKYVAPRDQLQLKSIIFSLKTVIHLV